MRALYPAHTLFVRLLGKYLTQMTRPEIFNDMEIGILGGQVVPLVLFIYEGNPPGNSQTVLCLDPHDDNDSSAFSVRNLDALDLKTGNQGDVLTRRCVQSAPLEHLLHLGCHCLRC